MAIRTQVSAARTDRSLVGAVLRRRERLRSPVEGFWYRLIDTAEATAKQTQNGVATDDAIRARWWLEEQRPAQAQKEEWATSFACACSWLSLDVEAERARRLLAIEAALAAAAVEWARGAARLRRAVVLTCAGLPTAVARQFRLPLFTEEELLEQAELFQPESGLTLVPARAKAARLDRVRRPAA